jgi:hypothetical protein
MNPVGSELVSRNDANRTHRLDWCSGSVVVPALRSIALMAALM